MKPTPGFGPSTGPPLSMIPPSFGRSRPATRLRMVLLPQPDGPTTATNSPACTSRLTRSIAVSDDTPSGATKRFVTPTRSSTDAVFSIGRIQRSVDPDQLLLQHHRRPRLLRAGGTFHAALLERARDVLEILVPGTKRGLERIGEGALLGAERAPERLVHQPGMDV